MTPDMSISNPGPGRKAQKVPVGYALWGLREVRLTTPLAFILPNDGKGQNRSMNAHSAGTPENEILF